MSDTTLYAVDLYDINYPCLYYAMQRIGTRLSREAFVGKEKVFSGTMSKGDILVWHIEEPSRYCNAQSIRGNVPIHDTIIYDRHYAVYEGDGLVSDTTVQEETSIVFIRIRRLDSLNTKPRGIIFYADAQ